MALIKCPECGKEISDKAAACPNCGYPIASEQKLTKVWVSFPVWSGQMVMNNCYVYDERGNTIAQCKQGETVSFHCQNPMTIEVKMQNCFGKPSMQVKPGDKVKVGFRGFGKIYLALVDELV